MRYLLCGINAKYIHSNLAIFCLKAYAGCYGPESAEYIIKEYTINQYVEDILEDIYQAHADVIIFSCYIWNISYVRELAVELKKICPHTPIWVGGPEVSYHAESFLKDNPAVDLVMQGEGEEQFCALVELAERNGNSEQLPIPISDLPGDESDRPGDESDRPGDEPDLPGEESDWEESDCPGEESDCPGDGSDCPGDESDLPADESDLSADVSNLAGDESDLSADVFNRPADVSAFPAGVALRVNRLHGDYQVAGMHNNLQMKHQLFRDDSSLFNAGFAPPVDMDRIPFVYDDFHLFDHKIIYYESSRGCPFSCSYCLSSIDKTVRFRSLDLVLPELQRFLDAGVPQVKFVDRTFNCRKSHAMAIWSYIHEHDNDVTNFHFEISADLLDDEEMRLFEQMRPGLIQLEIGVQSTYGPAIEAIRRHMDLNRLFENVDRVHAMGNIHQHLDLIAGLPYETFEHFKKSFNDLYAHEPDQLQLGFLKVLKGTYMEEKQEEYGMSARSLPPYEILKTRWISYDEILRLKGVEEMVETYYNSMQYSSVLKYTVPTFPSAFDYYEALSVWYREHDLHKRNHNRLEKYEILRDFILYCLGDNGIYNSLTNVINPRKDDLDNLAKDAVDVRLIDEMLTLDMYSREKMKKRPSWAKDQREDRKSWRCLYREHGQRLFPEVWDRETYDSKKAENQSHMEKFSFNPERWIKEGVLEYGEFLLLFDYSRRDPLSHNALIKVVDCPGYK